MSRNPDLVETLDVLHEDVNTRVIYVLITETDYVVCDVITVDEDTLYINYQL